MTLVDEAVARYHKILESEGYKDLAWVHALREQMQARHLFVSGRPVSPFLRPHFVTTRQLQGLVKAAESLSTAIARVKQMALATPALLSRMELLPAEKMLASVDPGYSHLAVTSLLDTHMQNGHLHFVDYSADPPLGILYNEALAEIFYDCPPVKEFRKRYSLKKVGGAKSLLSAMLKAYKEFGSKKQPQIAIVEFKQPFHTTESNETVLLREFFEKQAFRTEIVSPEMLDFRDGVLRRGDFAIDLVFRRVKVHDFLIRYDLSHPLVRAYRTGAVCVVNSFRSELAQKKAIFDMLTDEDFTTSFPASERKAIRDFIPWTRLVAHSKTKYQDQAVDLPEFILKNREKLVLRPNDDSGEEQDFEGWTMDDMAWERAVKTALRTPYVAQERVAPATAQFPIESYNGLEMREMRIDLQPHVVLGKVQGLSSWLSSAAGQGFSTVVGLAPTFILDSK